MGRHMVSHFAAQGHRVVRFHRGKTTCDLPDGVEERLGDRNDDLSAVDRDEWDAVVDVSCYEPDQIRRSLNLKAARYLFISTVNVYQDVARPGVSEDAPTIDTFDTTDEALIYGGKKAACERLVMERFDGRAIVLRPGMIVGKWDNTGRFTFWCERVLRGGLILVPGPASRPVQFIDAADLARFTERVLAQNLCGSYNVVGPRDTTTMEDLLRECQSVTAERGAPSARAAWVDGDFLLEHGVKPWTEMPLWLPEPQWSGVLQISNAKAVDAGLEYRPIADSVRGVLDWTRSAPNCVIAGLASARESELLLLVQG
ncbi:MAG: NAD-dependent epimerase/dehydratase family protein [Candidatus Eremiobacteraeota bacterium]|nr:NAD-dependent epimerase/dehydratase family protein [Candidatus Eremiobacteraeota bacterium]